MTGIPPQYAFLSAIGPLPRTIVQGLALLGTNEVPGHDDNPVIVSWALELNLGDVYSADEIPWCGLFAAVVCERAGKYVQPVPLWARNWQHYGQPVRVNAGTESKPRLISSGFSRPMGPEAPSLGDICVFVRPGGGHVAFYIAEDNETFHVLGGNQSDSVTITRVAKARCIAVRRPLMKTPPASLRPFHVQADGHVSLNEA